MSIKWSTACCWSGYYWWNLQKAPAAASLSPLICCLIGLSLIQQKEHWQLQFSFSAVIYRDIFLLAKTFSLQLRVRTHWSNSSTWTVNGCCRKLRLSWNASYKNDWIWEVPQSCKFRSTDSVESTAHIRLSFRVQKQIAKTSKPAKTNYSSIVVYVELRSYVESYEAVQDDVSYKIC